MRPGPGSLTQSSDQTEQYPKALKLLTFLREHDKVSRQCAAEGVGHPDFLLRLSELELIARHHHMVDRRIKAARFPTVKSLDSFDFLTFPSLNKALVNELARSEHIGRRDNVIAVGNSGRWQDSYSPRPGTRRMPEGAERWLYRCCSSGP